MVSELRGGKKKLQTAKNTNGGGMHSESGARGGWQKILSKAETAGIKGGGKEANCGVSNLLLKAAKGPRNRWRTQGGGDYHSGGGSGWHEKRERVLTKPGQVPRKTNVGRTCRRRRRGTVKNRPNPKGVFKTEGRGGWLEDRTSTSH